MTRRAPAIDRTRLAAAGRMVLCLGTALLASIIILAAATAGPAYGRTRRAGVAAALGSRMLLRALGIRLLTTGAARDGAALVVANHVSWVDILAITATSPVVPVAKCEVAHWPLIGPLARRTGTVFVSRRIGRDLPATVDRITSALRRGYRVLLFPEGTTTSGGPPGAFHRAGFQAAVDAAAPVQPVSIDYADRRGRPTGSTAFVGDDTLLASTWRVLRAGPVLVRVRWHTPAAATEDGGHRAHHRARAADDARGRISHALGAESHPVDPRRVATNVTSVSRRPSRRALSRNPVIAVDRPDRAA
ncbi:lysophospholipid acyltransferase family protein [Nakamurella sp.]|uniref:lysophospholipid acyltransferase family protein n=1 Tax=Nakamurella sp. TaxID=1869182 RepID=UPI0037835069